MGRSMYRLSSTNALQNGRTFDSLAEAKQTADRLSASQPDTPFDVIAFVDRDSFRVVYSPSTCRAFEANVGTYRKGV